MEKNINYRNRNSKGKISLIINIYAFVEIRIRNI